jgi:hypothetical protein
MACRPCGPAIAEWHGVNGLRTARRSASRRGARAFPRLPRGELFSLGGVLMPFARTPGSLAPWLLSAAVLVSLACWDPLARGGPFDTILLGLAAYELLIALTRPAGEPSPSRAMQRGAGL